MRLARPKDRALLRSAAAAALVLFAIAPGCTDYKQVQSSTRTIYEVRVTTNPGDVGSCRFLETVDSRDSARGCGLTVQPTPEECLRYQVRRAGGDTLLRDGPIGRAYACSAHDAAGEEEPSPSPAPASATPPTPRPAAVATPAPVPPPPPAAEPRAASGVRLTADRQEAKGCVYLGDFSGVGCDASSGQPSADCAEQARNAGGDLILVEDSRAQIFSCKARP